MKKLIRTSVFETNSSSTHSISIADSTKQFVFDSIYPDTDGVVTLTGGEFGWDYFDSNEAIVKANYAAQALGDDCENLIEVIREQTGAEFVLIDTSHGYIDHQSVGLVNDDKEWLRKFIFSKGSWLYGGNDND
jgi:hypothetical protein